MDKKYVDDFERIQESPALTIEIQDDASMLKGYVCIHSVGKYGSCGGMRCVPNVTKDEVQLLAKAMTFKYSFFNIEQGGAKAGLVVPYDCSEGLKSRILQKAALHFKPLVMGRIFSPWSDMNFYNNDRVTLFNAMDLEVSPPKISSSYCTAVTAFLSIKATIECLGISPSKAQIILEGFGEVSYYLTRKIKEYGSKIIAVSNYYGCIYNSKGIDADFLISRYQSAETDWIKDKGPWENLEREQLFSIPCDIMVPGARVHSVDETMAKKIQAKAIVPFANVPCTPTGLKELDARGVHFLPDFMVNGGGVCSHFFEQGNSGKNALAFVEKFESMVGRMLRQSECTGVPSRMLAEEVAHSNYGAIARGAYSQDSRKTRLVSLLQRKHLIPGDIRQKIREKRILRTLDTLDSSFV